MPLPSKKLTTLVGFKLLGGLIVLALVVQGALIYQLAQDDKVLHIQTIKEVLIDSIKNLQTNLAVDPLTGRQYLPSLRLVLPAKTEERIFSRGSGDDSTILLASQTSQSQALMRVREAKSLEDTFKEVDIAQKCSRQVVLSFASTAPTDSIDKLTLKQSKKLADGRMVHVYENGCPYPADPMLRDLSNLQSY